MAVIVERAAAADLDALEGILRASFRAPWTRDMMREELGRSMARVTVLRPGPGEPPVAFVDAWVVADELHVLNVATHPDHRRRGHARALLEEALVFARAEGIGVVTLELRRTNEAARGLYDALGFVPIGVRKGYYADTGEDAVVMLWRPDSGAIG